jgi:hypothetical protein
MHLKLWLSHSASSTAAECLVSLPATPPIRKVFSGGLQEIFFPRHANPLEEDII